MEEKSIRWYNEISNLDDIYITQWFVEFNWVKSILLLYEMLITVY